MTSSTSITPAVTILGCGWLGLPLAQYLVERGYRVKGSTTRVDKIGRLEASGIEAYVAKLSEAESWPDSFLQSDTLVLNVPSKAINEFQLVARVVSKSPVKQVIFTSSTSVYDASNETMSELSPTNQSPLVEIERIFTSQDRFDTTVLRFSGLFGSERKPGNWFKEKKVPNPEGFVNMVHLVDCTEVIYRIIKDSAWGETFNVCADTHPTRRSFYTEARKVLELPAPEFEETAAPYKIISNEKLKKHLNYQFKAPDVIKALSL